MSNIKLHLGCGKRNLPGYIHIDLDTHDHIDYYQDIKSLPMIEDNSVDVIYNCGTLEYFDRYEVGEVLDEWRRKLKTGGILRISVPNFESVLEVYTSNGRNLDGEGILGLLYGRIEIETPEGFDILYHKTVYDFKSLEGVLLENGFHAVRRYDCHEVLPEDYDDYSKAYMPYMDRTGIKMSLNVECIKGDS